MGGMTGFGTSPDSVGSGANAPRNRPRRDRRPGAGRDPAAAAARPGGPSVCAAGPQRHGRTGPSGGRAFPACHGGCLGRPGHASGARSGAACGIDRAGAVKPVQVPATCNFVLVNRTGLPWRDAPADDGPHKTLCNLRFCRSRKGGVCAVPAGTGMLSPAATRAGTNPGPKVADSSRAAWRVQPLAAMRPLRIPGDAGDVIAQNFPRLM